MKYNENIGRNEILFERPLILWNFEDPNETIEDWNQDWDLRYSNSLLKSNMAPVLFNEGAL